MSHTDLILESLLCLDREKEPDFAATRMLMFGCMLAGIWSYIFHLIMTSYELN